MKLILYILAIIMLAPVVALFILIMLPFDPINPEDEDGDADEEEDEHV